jgi:hypothetical protein
MVLSCLRPGRWGNLGNPLNPPSTLSGGSGKRAHGLRDKAGAPFLPFFQCQCPTSSMWPSGPGRAVALVAASGSGVVGFACWLNGWHVPWLLASSQVICATALLSAWLRVASECISMCRRLVRDMLVRFPARTTALLQPWGLPLSSQWFPVHLRTSRYAGKCFQANP